MPIDIRKYLKHVCQLQKVQNTQFGDTSVTSTYTISCFSYYGTAEGVLSGRQFTTRPGWTVVMPNSLYSFLAVDDNINNLVDDRGNTLVNSATISEITVYNHHLYGTQFVQVQLRLG